MFLLAGFPWFGLAVRRLHDIDRSAWWLLLLLVPFGGVVLLVFFMLEGTPGRNRYSVVEVEKVRPGALVVLAGYVVASVGYGLFTASAVEVLEDLADDVVSTAPASGQPVAATSASEDVDALAELILSEWSVVDEEDLAQMCHGISVWGMDVWIDGVMTEMPQSEIDSLGRGVIEDAFEQAATTQCASA